MACGMFGKLSAKRDFISVSAPQSFLKVWEPWITGSITASRLKMKMAWQESYLTAPIWRFWLGAGHCGVPVAGAFMASLDGVGRFFPLTVLALSPADHAIPSPADDPQDAWYEAAEDFLLMTLDQDLPYEDFTEALGKLAAPASLPPAAAATSILSPSEAVRIIGLTDMKAPDAIAAIGKADAASDEPMLSYWWTSGGEGFPPHLMKAFGLPEVDLFTFMLTGHIDGVAPPAAVAAGAETEAASQAAAGAVTEAGAA